MKRILLLIALLVVGLAGLAQAGEVCANVASTTGGTTILTAAQNFGSNLLCQNLGSNDVNVSINGTPVAGQQGFLLKAGGGSISMPVYPVTKQIGSGQVRVPGGTVKGITGSSTSYTCCVSW